MSEEVPPSPFIVEIRKKTEKGTYWYAFYLLLVAAGFTFMSTFIAGLVFFYATPGLEKLAYALDIMIAFSGGLLAAAFFFGEHESIRLVHYWVDSDAMAIQNVLALNQRENAQTSRQLQELLGAKLSVIQDELSEINGKLAELEKP